MNPKTSITVMQGHDKRRGCYFKQLECVIDGKKFRVIQTYDRKTVTAATPNFWVEEEKRLLAKLEEIAEAVHV